MSVLYNYFVGAGTTGICIIMFLCTTCRYFISSRLGFYLFSLLHEKKWKLFSKHRFLSFYIHPHVQSNSFNFHLRDFDLVFILWTVVPAPPSVPLSLLLSLSSSLSWPWVCVQPCMVYIRFVLPMSDIGSTITWSSPLKWLFVDRTYSIPVAFCWWCTLWTFPWVNRIAFVIATLNRTHIHAKTRKRSIFESWFITLWVSIHAPANLKLRRVHCITLQSIGETVLIYEVVKMCFLLFIWHTGLKWCGIIIILFCICWCTWLVGGVALMTFSVSGLI